MLFNASELRKLMHSIKYLEYHWLLYKKRFPTRAKQFKYRSIVKAFIRENKYESLKDFTKIPLSNNFSLSKKQYDEIKTYAKINKRLIKSLNKKRVSSFKTSHNKKASLRTYKRRRND